MRVSPPAVSGDASSGDASSPSAAGCCAEVREEAGATGGGRRSGADADVLIEDVVGIPPLLDGPQPLQGRPREGAVEVLGAVIGLEAEVDAIRMRAHRAPGSVEERP